jgi:hypothetical protein
MDTNNGILPVIFCIDPGLLADELKNAGRLLSVKG